MDKYDTCIITCTAAWCGHCKAFGPELAKLNLLMEKNGHKVVSLTDEENEHDLNELSNKSLFNGFPTVLIKTGKDMVVYEGSRLANNIYNFYLTKLERYKNYKPTENKKTNGIIACTAGWCNHCTVFKPELEKLKKMVDNEELNVTVYDADKDEEQINNLSIPVKGYPSIFMQINEQLIQYTGPRTAESMYQALIAKINGGKHFEKYIKYKNKIEYIS